MGLRNSNGQFIKGLIPWNKGKKLHYYVWNKGLSMPPRHTTPHSEETKLKCSIAQKKRWEQGLYKNRILDYLEIGRKSSLTHRKKEYFGERHHLWKGGIETRNTNNFKYRNWRKKVFERDDYTCQYCLERGCYLHAHHIKSWDKYLRLRYNLNNGLTLCKSCHYDLHKERN